MCDSFRHVETLLYLLGSRQVQELLLWKVASPDLLFALVLPRCCGWPGCDHSWLWALVLMQLTQLCPSRHLGSWAVEEQQCGGSWGNSGCFPVTFAVQLSRGVSYCEQGGFPVVREVVVRCWTALPVLVVLLTEVVEGGSFLLWCFGCFWETHHCVSLHCKMMESILAKFQELNRMLVSLTSL